MEMAATLKVKLVPHRVVLDESRYFDVIRAYLVIDGREVNVTSLLSPEDTLKAHESMGGVLNGVQPGGKS